VTITTRLHTICSHGLDTAVQQCIMYYHSVWQPVTHSLTGTLDRPRVVAPSKTCGHVRSSRRRWHWAQCRPRPAAPTISRVVLAGASTGLMSGLPPARVSTARHSAEWAGVASGSRRMWPKMESCLWQIRIAKPSSPVWLVTEAFVKKWNQWIPKICRWQWETENSDAITARSQTVQQSTMYRIQRRWYHHNTSCIHGVVFKFWCTIYFI